MIYKTDLYEKFVILSSWNILTSSWCIFVFAKKLLLFGQTAILNFQISQIDTADILIFSDVIPITRKQGLNPHTR